MNRHFDWIPIAGDWVQCNGELFQVKTRSQIVRGGWLEDIKLKDAAGNVYLLSRCAPAPAPAPLTADEIQTCLDMCRAMLETGLDLGDVALFRHLSPEDLALIFSHADPLIREEFESIALNASTNPVEAIV